MEYYPLFSLGGIVLGLYSLEKLAKDTTFAYEKSIFSGTTISYNAKSETEVDEVLQKVLWGGYSGYFKDLDGYLFEVAYNPFWEFDENDNLILL